MGQMTDDPNAYFVDGCGRCDRFRTDACSARVWAEGLAELRRICRAAGLEETAKWGHPCYMAHGRNIAIIGAFRSDFRLSFFEAGLLRDPERVLEKQGANTRFADMIRFTDVDRPAAIERTLLTYLAEAKGHAERGLREPKDTSALELPQELVSALDHDPDLAEAFHGLTPGRQKSYVINLTSAKKSATRIARIEKFRDKIIAGKGALER